MLIIKGVTKYNYIGLVVHNFNKIRMRGRGLEGINGYPYLKHIVEMWPDY